MTASPGGSGQRRPSNHLFPTDARKAGGKGPPGATVKAKRVGKRRFARCQPLRGVVLMPRWLETAPRRGPHRPGTACLQPLTASYTLPLPLCRQGSSLRLPAIPRVLSKRSLVQHSMHSRRICVAASPIREENRWAAVECKRLCPGLPPRRTHRARRLPVQRGRKGCPTAPDAGRPSLDRDQNSGTVCHVYEICPERAENPVANLTVPTVRFLSLQRVSSGQSVRRHQ